MKIRSGFVSNSSSSSFIVNCKDFGSIRDLAIQMIQIRDWENDDDDIRAINNLELDPDHPLSFSTCNYDTYIAKDGDYYLVTTEKTKISISIRLWS